MIATAVGVTALSIFCSSSQYSAKQWGDLLRQELPELTDSQRADEDIEWLCGLTEATESHEPVIVHKDPGRFSQPLTRTITGKRRRRGRSKDASELEGTATSSSSQNSREALPLSESAPANATVTGRKPERTALDPSLPIRRSPRLSSEQSAPGSGKPEGAQPALDRQSGQVTGQPQPPSLLAAAASQRPYRILVQLSRAKAQNKIFKFTVPGPVPVRLAHCLFCRLGLLPLFCSSSANIILPLGRTNSFSSRLVMIQCPQRTGKQSQQP
jgi:hypothetical protein